MVLERDAGDRELVADSLSPRGWSVEATADSDFASALFASHAPSPVADVDRIVRRSPRMRALCRILLRVAKTPASTVLVLGETGAGKEVVARAIHRLSTRKGPFVALSCPAVPETLFESELFGHERGAFTGAGGTKRGLAELAGGGTLLLDEVGDMPLELQTKLLRVLQEKVIRRVGGTRDISVDIRVVATTNRDLRRLVREGKFREDLFYRLTVIPVFVPPLRERREDIVPLARMFLYEYCRDVDLPVPHLGPQMEAELLEHRWPGNVRELQNWAQRTALLTLAPQSPGESPCCFEDSSPPRGGDNVVGPTSARCQDCTEDPICGERPGVFGAAGIPWGTGEMGCAWPGALRPPGRPAEGACPEGDWSEGTITLRLSKCSLDEAERAVIASALGRAGGNKNKAAKMLGINRATLYRKLARFGWRSPQS